MYVFCIKRLYKSKFCMIMNEQKSYTSHFYIYTKNVQNIQNLHKVWTKNGLKLEMYVFCTYYHCTNYKKPIQLANWNSFCICFLYIATNNVQTIQNLYNKLTETTFVCFLYIQTMYKLYKMYTNVNWIIYAVADVCFLYTKPLHSLPLNIFASITSTTSG